MKKIVVLAALLLLPVVYAQLDWSITDFRCGNKVLDDFELCDKDANGSFCDELGAILEIDTVCDTQHCTCLPRVNKAYCGNNIREGVEVCDGDGEDKCAEFGQAINISLTCNKKTCGCNINQTIPQDYNPVVVGQLVNATQKSSVCGDKKIERDEDCDPPNTLCTTSTQDPGICTDNCRCVKPEMLGVEEEIPVPEENVTANVTANVSVENVTVEIEENVTENVTEAPEEEKPGFFARLWAWLVGLFS
jgi:hypothetical protein